MKIDIHLNANKRLGKNNLQYQKIFYGIWGGKRKTENNFINSTDYRTNDFLLGFLFRTFCHQLKYTLLITTEFINAYIVAFD